MKKIASTQKGCNGRSPFGDQERPAPHMQLHYRTSTAARRRHDPIPLSPFRYCCLHVHRIEAVLSDLANFPYMLTLSQPSRSREVQAQDSSFDYRHDRLFMRKSLEKNQTIILIAFNSTTRTHESVSTREGRKNRCGAHSEFDRAFMMIPTSRSFSTA